MALIILTLLSLVALSQSMVIDPLFDSKIVNGEDVKLGEIPYQVSLQARNNKHFCGGSILDDNYVITVAHCVVDKFPGEIKVVAGTIDLNNPQSTHEVEKIIVHESYTPFDSWRNDIALLRVKNPFVTSKYISHVPLPPKGYVVNDGDVAVVSGWGRGLRNILPTKLKQANIYIVDQDYCVKLYKNIKKIFITQVCAYDSDTSKGSCHGDSGGPLTVDGKLVGLVSWANSCASIFYPSVYTRVVSYLDWINGNAI